MKRGSLDVYVHVWCEVDPTLNVRVDRKTGEMLTEDSDLLMRISPLGRAGIAAACGLEDLRVTAFAIGAAHRDALRHALAAGASAAVELVPSTQSPEAHPAETGEWTFNPTSMECRPFLSALARWLNNREAQVVIADRIAGILAGESGWSHLAGLDEMEIADDRLRAVRHLGRGEKEIVTANLPVAVRLQPGQLIPPYIARARLWSVANRKIHSETLPVAPGDLLAEPGPFQPIRLRTRGTHVQPHQQAGGMERLHALMTAASGRSGRSKTDDAPGCSTAEEMAEEFVRYILHHELLPPGEWEHLAMN